ncbi:MAG: hypothetical protein LH610_12550 [Sphingomonas bacterium]|nr:hypothetical protein [Sphingomonas bacterium]
MTLGTPPPLADSAPRQWWQQRWFVAALVLIAAVPLLYPDVPPLVDLIGHMGRYRVELDLANSPDLQQYYSFQWQLIGNLGVDLLVYPLAKLVGLELAVKLIVMSIPPLTVAGFLWVAREVHNRLPPTVIFALPLAFSHPFMFGFVNYALAMALAFLSFGLWLRLGRLGRTRLRAMMFVPISFILFVTHAFGWGTLGLLAFSAEAVRQHDRGISWWRSAIRAAMNAVVMAGPLLLILLWRSDISHGMTSDWFNWAAKATSVMQALRDRWSLFDQAGLAIVLLVLVFAIVNQRLTLSRNLAFSALVLVVVFLLLPRIVFGSAYADMRLVPFLIATALLGIRFKNATDPRLARNLALLGLAFYLGRVAATTASLAMAANNQSARLTALDHVPRGARLVHLVNEDCSTQWALPRNTHLGAMAIVRRQAFSNDQWQVEGSNLLRVTYTQARYFIADPSQMIEPAGCRPRKTATLEQSLRAIPPGAFDYLWLIDAVPDDPRLLAGATLVWSGPGSRLYRLSGAPKDVGLGPQQPADER